MGCGKGGEREVGRGITLHVRWGDNKNVRGHRNTSKEDMEKEEEEGEKEEEEDKERDEGEEKRENEEKEEDEKET